MQTAAALGFAPQDPAFVADPYPAASGCERPLIYDGSTDHWLVSRHQDVNALLRDRRLGRSYGRVASHEEMGRAAPPREQGPFWRLIEHASCDPGRDI